MFSPAVRPFLQLLRKRFLLGRSVRLDLGDAVALGLRWLLHRRQATERHRQERYQVQGQARIAQPLSGQRRSAAATAPRTSSGAAMPANGCQGGGPAITFDSAANRAAMARPVPATCSNTLWPAVVHEHQHERAHRIAEQDVAGPDENEVQRPEHGQRQRAAQVRTEEGAPGLLGTGKHHGEAHPEQQREHRPELAAHEHVDEPAGPVVDAGDATRQAGLQVRHRAVEELDVHHEDAEQGEAADHVERMDAIACLDRLEGGGHAMSPKWTCIGAREPAPVSVPEPGAPGKSGERLPCKSERPAMQAVRASVPVAGRMQLSR